MKKDPQGSLTALANLGITAVTYNHLGLTETVEAYNQHGQLLRVRQKNGVHASFQYGHNSTVPVMQALNATIPYADAPTQAVVAGDASYNGFESGHMLPLSADNQFWGYNVDLFMVILEVRKALSSISKSNL